MKGNTRSNFGFKGWMMVIYLGFSFFCTSWVVGTYNVSVYAFQGIRGWDQAYIMSLNTIGGWVGIVFVAIFGMLMAKGKIKLRPFILICAILLALAVSFLGLTSSFGIFVILNIIYQVCYALWANLGNQTLCNNWFPRKKGLAIGWATFGFPLGAGIGVVVFSKMLGGIGLGLSYVLVGIFCLLVGVLGMAFFREYPEESGYYPDNDRSLSREQLNKELEAGRKLMANSPWTAKRMLKTKETWLLALSAGFMMMFATGSILQVVPRLVAMGYERPAATTMLTITSLFALPGSYICGWIDQKLGTRKALIITNLIAAVACVLYTINSTVPIWIALVLIGVALGGSSNYIMSVTTTYWGRYHFKKAFAIMLPIQQFIGKGGSAIVALISKAASYNLAYYIMAILGVVAALIVIPVKDDFTAKREAQFAAEDNG